MIGTRKNPRPFKPSNLPDWVAWAIGLGIIGQGLYQLFKYIITP